MYNTMFGHVAFLWKSLEAYGTLEWLLSCMTSVMSLQQPFLCKSFTTLVTSERMALSWRHISLVVMFPYSVGICKHRKKGFFIITDQAKKHDCMNEQLHTLRRNAFFNH